MRRTIAALVLLAVSAAAPALAQRLRPFATRTGGPRLSVAARALTGVLPKSVTVSPDGEHVVVCNFGRHDVDNVMIYDAATLERVGSVDFLGNAVESAFSPDGRTLYVSNFRRHVVEVIDFATRSVRAEVPVGQHPKALAVSPDGATLYVANYFGHTVSVVDASELRETAVLRTEERPRGLGIMGDGSVVAAAFHGDRVHVFRPPRYTEENEWEVCRFPRDIRTAPDGRTFFMTCSLGYVGFYRIDDGGRYFGIAPTGRNPRSIGLSADGRWLGVANFGSSDVTLVDTVRHTHRRIRVPGARSIVGLAMHPGPEIRMYATSWDTGELILLTRQGRLVQPPEPE